MLSFKEYFLKFKTQFPFEHTQIAILLAIVSLIMLSASYALYRPINTEQLDQILKLSHQQSFPATQDMAVQLVTQKKISNAEYYRLIYAYEYESSRIREYPALNINNFR